MNTKRITEMALLTAVGLIIHVIESFIQQLIPVPGVKPGLANIVTLLALYRLPKREALLVIAARVILSSIFGGGLLTFIYSFSGCLMSIAVMLPLTRVIRPRYMFLPSVLGAAAHNAGQIIAAIIINRLPSLAAYLPVLVLTGCIAGLFTGLAAGFVHSRLPNR